MGVGSCEKLLVVLRRVRLSLPDSKDDKEESEAK